MTYPFTIYALMSNSNDALVAALVLAAVWSAGRAPARGAFDRARGADEVRPARRSPRCSRCTTDGARAAIAGFAVAFAAAAALAFAALLGHLDLRAFWDHTIAFQAERGSPFSVWGLYDSDVGWLDVAQRVAQAAARDPRARARAAPSAA